MIGYRARHGVNGIIALGVDETHTGTIYCHTAAVCRFHLLHSTGAIIFKFLLVDVGIGNFHLYSAYDTVNLTLYFTNETGDGLIAVNREKAYNTNISLDRLVVEEVIAGPSATVEGVYPTINPDTKPISVLTKDGICYVNLDETFLIQVYNVTPDVTIFSIVNSLAELSNVNKVQISINGDTSKMYREKYSFSTLFERNLDLVTTLNK